MIDLSSKMYLLIYVKIFDFLTVKYLIIESPWMCTSDPYEKLLLHKEIFPSGNRQCVALCLPSVAILKS